MDIANSKSCLATIGVSYTKNYAEETGKKLHIV